MLAVRVAAIAATAAPAAAFSYTIDVVGEGVTGTGSILFPADAGADPTGVDLTLTATLFGNVVTFTEAHILSVGWAGAVMVGRGRIGWRGRSKVREATLNAQRSTLNARAGERETEGHRGVAGPWRRRVARRGRR